MYELHCEIKTRAVGAVIQIALVLITEKSFGKPAAKLETFRMKDNQAAVPVLPLTQDVHPTFSRVKGDLVADLESHLRLKIFRSGSEHYSTALETEQAMDFYNEREFLVYGQSSEQRCIGGAAQFLLHSLNVC